MEKKKGINPFWAFIAIILGWRLFKHFDFTTFKFSDPYFDIIYGLVFTISIYFIVKDYNKTAEKQTFLSQLSFVILSLKLSNYL